MIGAETLRDGTVLLDASSVVDVEEVRAAQRELAEWGHRGFVTVHAAGRTSGLDATDELDALGRVSVRLNIGFLVAVGDDAHTLHRAAEHEGSWDGESIPVPSIGRAYDEIRSRRGESVAILITGSTSEPMADLAEKVRGAGA